MTYKLTNTSQPADPYYGAVSLLLHGDGADGSTQIIDSSPNPKTVTVVNDARISTTESKFNGSSLVAGVSPDFVWGSNRLQVPAGADFAYGTGDFTVEAWLYVTSQAALNIGGSFWNQAIFGTNYFICGVSPTGPYFTFATSGGGTNVFGPAISLNTWTHVAIVRSAGQVRVYTNGVGGTAVSCTQDFNNTTYVPTIGSYNHNAGQVVYYGYIDDLRITKGVARYTGNFTPPTQPFFNNFKTGYDPHYFYDVSLLLKGDGTNGSTNIVDSSFDPKTITVNGDAQISTAQSKFGGSSLKFDGTGDYLSISDTSVFNVGTGDFTIEWWQKLAATNLNYTQFKFYSNGGIKAANGAIQLYTGPSNTNVAGTTTFTTDWEHIAVVRSSGVMSFFHKGIYVPPNLANTGSATSITPTLIEIGTPIATYVNMNGYIDDFRITKGVARYTSNFTPPGSLPNY